jgi:hypothetical protein
VDPTGVIGKSYDMEVGATEFAIECDDGNKMKQATIAARNRFMAFIAVLQSSHELIWCLTQRVECRAALILRR